MKRFSLIFVLCLACLLSACIDEQYDLTNLESDGMAIGSDTSEFLMPLVTVKFSPSDINQNSNEGMSSISELREQINVWLPAILPNNVDYIDIKELGNNPDYRIAILEALFDEMATNKEKRLQVCGYVMETYAELFIKALKQSSNPALVIASSQITNLPTAEGASILAQLFTMFPNDVQSILHDISTEDLLEINLDDVMTEIPSLDISEDIELMLSENLDPSTVENAVNALYLFGEATSNFPFKIHLQPTIQYTQIDLGDICIDYNATSTIQETRIYREDLQTLFNGSQLVMPISLDRYYPYKEFNDDSEICISFSLRKTGGLKI